MTTDVPETSALLILPRLRVQNANAISSPLTWGFPAITAFAGLMTALERQLGPEGGMAFHGVGVICHAIEPQVTQGGYTRSFHLTRNPVLADGSTAGIVEEGRIHLDLTLLFDVEVDASLLEEGRRQAMAARIFGIVSGMRIAGGSVVPHPLAHTGRQHAAQLLILNPDQDKAAEQLRQMRGRWMPGAALVSRDDLLTRRLADMQMADPDADLIDAWLELSSFTHRSVQVNNREVANDVPKRGEWQVESRPGWIVPIPVGFVRLGPLQDPGSVRRARDPAVPFAFVESVYSVGEWISPHRLTKLDELFWRPYYEEATGFYRCINNYQPVSDEPAPQT